MDDFKLCYIEGSFAYFTTQELDKQWGDDWDDPLHNSGPPYQYNSDCSNESPYDIKKVAFDADDEILISPYGVYKDTVYSVKDINECKIPWLKTSDVPSRVREVYDGITLPDFIEFIKSCDGNVYFPYGRYRE